MPGKTETTEPTLEERVARIEKWANQPSWLDQPAEINGEPFVMGDSLPLAGKIIVGTMGAAILGVVVLVILGLCGVQL